MAAYYDRKDYSRPLHVDCSVEYELPNAAKPPAGARTEPLLMIHPCYYRRAESQRRSPFINNLPATRTRVPGVLHTQQYPVRYPGNKRDPLLCGTSSGDSGVSVGGNGVHWAEASSPESRLNNGPDSGIVDDKNGLTALTGSCWEPSSTEPATTRLYGSSRCQTNTDSNRELRDSTNQVSRHSWAVSSDFLNVSCAEVNNNNNNNNSCGLNSQLQHQGKDSRIHPNTSQNHPQPAVGVAAVAACKACQPQFLHPQQRSQQPWPGVTASAVNVACSGATRHRVRAVEPGPEHGASSLHRRAAPAWPAYQAPPAKRSRLVPPVNDCCKVCSQWSYPQCRGADDNSRILWNNESMLRLYQV